MNVKNITKKEKARRDKANAARREKTANLKKKGLCRCGAPLRRRVSGRPYCLCVTCHEKSKKAAMLYYWIGPARQRKPVKETVIDRRLKDLKGVRRRYERDGLGREAWWWLVSSYVDGKMRMRRFAVAKYGDREARRLAVAQRDEWERYAGRM